MLERVMGNYQGILFSMYVLRFISLKFGANCRDLDAKQSTEMHAF